MATLTPQLRSGGRRSLNPSLPRDGEAGCRISNSHPTESSAFRLLSPLEVEGLRGSDNVVLIEACFSSSDHPASRCESGQRHIPGALQLHPSYLESGTDHTKYYPNYQRPEDGNLLPDKQLHLALERIGIGPDSEVVVYGDGVDGMMAASRVAWGLLYAGVAQVSLLDGGLGAWRASGGLTVSTVRDVCSLTHQVTNPASAWRVRSQYLATCHEVRSVAEGIGSQGEAKLVDVRRNGEWDGSRCQNYPFFRGAGPIPSAVHQGDWRNLLDPVTLEMNSSLAEVAARWRAQGVIDASVEGGRTALIFYCGTGWRSSVGFLVASALGLRAKNYDAGFYGWSCGT